MVDWDGKSEPNRNIYRVLDDDYVPLKDRPIVEEDVQAEFSNIQSRTPIGGTDAYDPGNRRGSGAKLWATAVALLLVALIISAGIMTGAVNIANVGNGNKVAQSEQSMGTFAAVLPDDGALLYSNNLTLAWTPAQNAVSYELMIDDDPSFILPFKDVQTTQNSYSLSLMDGIYHWKVLAIGEEASSNWSVPKTFEIRTELGSAELLSPHQDQIITNTSLTYTWSSVDHASLYRLQVDDQSSFSSPEMDVLCNTTLYSIKYQYMNGERYYWRVMHLDGNMQGSWTSRFSFTVGIALSTPSPNAPLNNGVISSSGSFLRWSPVSGAFVYRLQLGNSSNFQSPMVDVLTNVSYFQASSLKANTTYYWRVMASNQNYLSAWSSTSSFFVGYEYFLRSYSWVYGGHTFSFDLNVSGQSYYEQRDLNRNNTSPFIQVDFAAHVNSSDPTVVQAATAIKNIAIAMRYDSENTLNLALAFVQSPNIQYDYDQNTTGFAEYTRYPIETLVDKVGDCDCKSVLFLSLIQTLDLGYNGVLLEYTGNVGHMAVGVAGSYTDRIHYDTYTYYSYLGQNYYYCETTGYGWLVGDIPSGKSKAIIIPA